MATQTPTPIFSLQAPKDVSISEIEAELSQIWEGYGAADNGNPMAMRATTFSLLVYEPEETQQLLAALGFYSGPIDGIAGPRTEAALRKAQKTYKLPVTGKANPDTLAKLREDLANRRQGVAQSEGNRSTGLHYAADGTGEADEIASSNPCRIITLCQKSGEDEGVTAQVAAYCPLQKQSQNMLVCCEYITLTGTAVALERTGGMVSGLVIPELPKFLWWKATPDPNNGLFKRLASLCNCVIVDSCGFHEPEAELLNLQTLVGEHSINIADLNWRRLAAWQELTAAAFDPPERRDAIKEVDRVTIDYEKGNPSQALMFLGWLASRLQWQAVSYETEGGDYDIRRIKFVTEDQRSVEAELAGIPTADWGDIAGDMIGLRLSSTNLAADCCTVLCSETTGCMRMEAQGGAQSCRIQQVTSLLDQKTEFLLSQQLQRGNREMLYQESLAVTAQILQLASRE